jgi:hypothetical protein
MKDSNKPAATTAAVAESETPTAAPPQTPEQLAATEKAMGMATTERPGFPQPIKPPVRMGIAPTTLEDGWRLAQMMARSELVPKNFRNKPEDVLVAIQMGVEIGFAPMQALQSIAVINGRPSVWGDGFIALIVSSPLYADHDEYFEVDGQRRDGLTPEDLKKDTTGAVCTFMRRGKVNPVTRRFTVGQARKAGLLGKDGPWQSYPDRMLMMRARSFAGRDCFPDLLRGIRTAEEVLDLPPDSTPALEPREVRRMSETSATTETATAGAAKNEPEAPPTLVLGPLGVTNVEQFMGGFTVTLSDGSKVDATDAADALELEKYKGTRHLVRLTCARVADTLQLQSFGIAD